MTPSPNAMMTLIVTSNIRSNNEQRNAIFFYNKNSVLDVVYLMVFFVTGYALLLCGGGKVYR